MSEQGHDSKGRFLPGHQKSRGRPKGSRNRGGQSFDERYDKARRRVRDPVTFLFKVMADESQDMGHRIKCATELVRMRYPMKKAVEIQGAIDNTITLRDMRTPHAAIDVTPVAEAIALDDDDTPLDPE